VTRKRRPGPTPRRRCRSGRWPERSFRFPGARRLPHGDPVNSAGSPNRGRTPMRPAPLRPHRARRRCSRR
jgi:hypothetical protein